MLLFLNNLVDAFKGLEFCLQVDLSMSSDRVADAAELLLRLSIFGFSQLSARDQLQKMEEVHNKLVHQGVPVLEQLPEESRRI